MSVILKNKIYSPEKHTIQHKINPVYAWHSPGSNWKENNLKPAPNILFEEVSKVILEHLPQKNSNASQYIWNLTFIFARRLVFIIIWWVYISVCCVLGMWRTFLYYFPWLFISIMPLLLQNPLMRMAHERQLSHKEKVELERVKNIWGSYHLYDVSPRTTLEQTPSCKRAESIL